LIIDHGLRYFRGNATKVISPGAQKETGSVLILKTRNKTLAVGSVIWTWFNEAWHQGDMPVMNAADHGTWLGSLVFDGARSFEGVVPDLEPHCKRVNDSAFVMGLKPTMSVDVMQKLVLDGLEKFDADAPVYIRPM